MISGLLLAAAPALPPREIGNPPAIYQDEWGGEPLEKILGKEFTFNRTSSSGDGGLLQIVAKNAEWPTGTSSKIELEPTLKQLLVASERSDSVNAEHSRENVFEIRRLTGLGWGAIAELLGVDRRTLHNWTKGTEVRERNGARIANLLSVLRFIDRGSATKNMTALQQLHGDLKLLELLSSERFAEVKDALGAGKSRSASLARSSFSDSSGDRLRGYILHPDADPVDVSEEAKMEPLPSARRRSVRRT